MILALAPTHKNCWKTISTHLKFNLLASSLGRSGGGAGKKDRPGEPCSQAIKISRLNHSHENERIFERLITDFFSTLVNVTQSTSDKGYLCATDKEGFSTGKRCFLVSFIDGVGEKERNSDPPKSAKLTRFILLTRKAVLHSSWYSSLSLSIYNCLPNLFLSLSSSLYLFACVAKMFAFKKVMIELKLKASYS